MSFRHILTELKMYTKDTSIDFPVFWGDSQIGQTMSNIRLQRSITGEVFPLWKDAVKADLNATTPMSGTYSNLDSYYVPFRYWQKLEFGISGWKAGWSPIPVPFIPNESLQIPSIQDEARAQALRALNSYIQKYQTPFNAQVFTGEFRETMKLLRHPLTTSSKLIKSFTKKHRSLASLVKDSKAPLSALSDSWLEFRFAILPLISDVSTILNLLNKDIRIKERQRFYGESSILSGAHDQRQVGFQNVTVDSEYSTSYRAECFIRCGLLAEVTTSIGTLTEEVKKNLTDFSQVIPTAWELLPYSFLIDYFVNIGDILNSEYNVSKLTSYTSMSEVVTKTVKYQMTNLDTSSSGILWSQYNMIEGSLENIPSNWDHFVATYRRVERTVLQSAIPPLVFKMPSSGIVYANLSALSLKFLLKE